MFETERKTIAEWQADGVLRVEDGNHGENRPRKHEFCNEGMAFIRAADMGDGSVVFDDAEKIDEVAQARVRKGIGRPEDILISHKGTVGRVARAPKDAPPFVCSPQTTFWRVLDEGRLDRDYLFALMRSYKFQTEFAVRAGETDMAGYVSLTSQRDLELELPPIEVQRAIGRALGALDDKIDLNRRMSATLEEMARALYRSWFVDFDPVHARALGQSPAHMAPTTAALFPDSFRPDGLPKGWKKGEVGDLITLQRGFDLPKKDRQDGSYPVMAAGGHHGTHSEFKVKGPGVMTGRSGVIGQVYLVTDDFWPLNTSLWIKEFKGCSAYFAYFFLGALDLSALNSGSAVPSLNRNNVHNLSADIPPTEIIAKFDEIVSPVFSRKHQLNSEIGVIASLRDALLPRLMSGELRIREAEEHVEEIISA